jgi:hypothetical protein
MMHSNDQSVLIRHREYLGEISGSISYDVKRSFEINPGNPDTFPWLSGVAARFQEYRIRGLVFHYIPSSGNAVSGTSAALGTVMLQTSYRSNDSEPSSKVELLNEYCSSESVPSEAFCHPIECDPKENPFNVQYVRTGGIPTGDSKLLYDLGITHVATSGQQVDGKVLGDLWVTYEIELKKPVVASNVTSTARSCSLTFQNGSITGSDLFSGTLTRWGQLTATAANNTVTFPTGSVGYWIVTYMLTPATTFSAATLGTSPSVSGAVAVGMSPSLGSVYYASSISGTSTIGQVYYTCAISITDPSVRATVTFPTASFTGTASRSQLWITPFNPLQG